jgi:site-specific DNA recombinase
VVRIFEEYATGNYSMQEISRMAARWGLRSRLKKSIITAATIHSILNNPFYYGHMRIKGEIHKHRYLPIIDFSLFQTCQDVIKVRNRKRSKYAGIPFIFRGLVRCAKCGTAYSPEIKKGKYVYLRPKPINGCDCRPINQEVILEDVRETLKEFRIPAHIMEEVRKQLKAHFQATKNHQNAFVDGLQNEYNLSIKRLDALLDMRLDGSITKDAYDKKALLLKQGQIEISSKMEGLARSDENFYETLPALLDIASRAHELFESSEIEKKRKIINMLIPNFEIRDKNIEKQ